MATSEFSISKCRRVPENRNEWAGVLSSKWEPLSNAIWEEAAVQVHEVREVQRENQSLSGIDPIEIGIPVLASSIAGAL